MTPHPSSQSLTSGSGPLASSTTFLLAWLALGLTAGAQAPSTPAGATGPPATSPAAGQEDEIVALGWTPESTPPPSCELVAPPVDAQKMVWLSVHDPAALPVPSYRCGAAEVPLPLAPDQGLFKRRDASSLALAWNLEVSGQGRAGAAAVLVDFAPFAPPRNTSAPSNPVSTLYGKPMTMPPQPLRDPSLRGRASKYNRVPEPPARPAPAVLTALAVTGVLAEDALVATADGTRWLSLDLGGEQPRLRFQLDADRIFGGEGRLLVAPRALQLDAETHVFAVDPKTLAVTSLGRPAPPDAGLWLRVTDARESGGVVEALVAVDQIGRDGFSSPYGLLARREGGAWTFPERYFTPAPPGVYPVLRFDASDPARLWLVAGNRQASRPLRAAVAP